MRESNKSKLTVFARLWAVPMVLFVLLSVAAVVAAMNDSSNWMGAAVVGTVVMLIVQIAQLVSAIIVRRWWYVAGAVIGLAVSTFVFLTSVTALAAGQWPTADSHDSTDSSEYAQELFTDEYSFPVEYQGTTPTISDFLVAITTQEDPGEWMDYLGQRWTEYRRGEKYEGHFTVDDSQGYVRYDKEETEHEGVVLTSVAEFRCWACDDNRYHIVATATNIFENGVAVDSQPSGITMYLYDSTTRRMAMVKGENLGVGRPDINGLVAFSLPSTGKDITATVYDTEEGEQKIVYVWNGKGFDLKGDLYPD